MASSKSGAAKRRRMAAKRRRMAAGPGRLLPELLANIHDRLRFLDRIAFAAVFAASCDDDDDVFTPCAPWLLLPCEKNENSATTATLFSVADRCAATVRAADTALRGHSVLGSSRGWVATADDMGQIYVVNPASGEQHALPDITTMGSFLSRVNHHWFTVRMKPFLTIRFGCGPPFHTPKFCGTSTFTADEMAGWFYRKIVLSTSPRLPGSYSAMLILDRIFGAPAFATSEDAAWTLAPSPDGVEDAIHHDGRFYSVSYAGVVEVWERDAESGTYTITAVTPRLTIPLEEEGGRKYLAAAPDGRLMVVIKYVKAKNGRMSWQDMWTCSFKVHVLGDNGQWKETRDIGDAALFVGLNNSLCVRPTRGCPEIEAGCVYFTDDELREAALRKRDESLSSLSSYRHCGVDNDDEFHDADVRAVGVYSLKDRTAKKVDLGQELYRRFSMPPVWITPSIP